MITASKLAGFFAAHAIWSASDSDGEPMSPILAYATQDGQRKMDRLMSNDFAKSVTIGKERLGSNPMNADDAVLLYDARIPVENEKLDAIIIEIRTYFSPDSKATLAVPYTPKSTGKFRVHKPKLMEWANCDDFDTSAAIQEFFSGVNEHEKGSAIWNQSLDESK